MRDIRFAIRLLAKSPVFLLTAVLSLGLGIGATTTMFSAFRAVFLTPLPYENPDRLVQIGRNTTGNQSAYATQGDVLFWRQFAGSFESIGTVGGVRAGTLRGGSEPWNVFTSQVGSELFSTLKPSPLRGRVFAPEDFQAGKQRVILLSSKLWQEQFAGDEQIIGKTISFDGDAFTVAGVMPKRFRFPTTLYAAWIPEQGPLNPVARGTVIARLKPGVTREAAIAELERLRPALSRQYPEAQRNFRFEVTGFDDRDTGKYRGAFYMLSGAVGLLILIACLNVANLIIARSMAREGEFAVRSALGAARGRLMRQVFTESLVLAIAGGALGIALAWAGNKALIAQIPSHYQIARLSDAKTDLAVLGFALLLTTATALLFGIGPAMILSRFSLRELGRTATQSASRSRWRGALVSAEVALSLTLLIGASLLLRSFVTLTNVNPGFRPDHLLTAMIPASTQLSKDKPKLLARVTDIVTHVEALPGVTAAGLTTTLPMGNINVSITFALPDQPKTEIGINYRAVSPGYFSAMGMTLQRGRWFDAQDSATAPVVVIVNQAFARKYLAGHDAIGYQLGGARNATIAGLVTDSHYKSLSAAPEPEMFGPYQQYLGPAVGATLALRTHGDPASIAASLRRTVHQLYPDQPVTDVQTMEARVSGSLNEPRLYTSLLGIFAAIALLLTAVGVYGVISHAVSHRTKEFGIRMALGARTGDVLRLVMGNGLALVLIGTAVGIAGAWALSRYMESLLFEVTAHDPLAFLTAPAVLILTAALACWFPARGATSIDPNVALRHE